MSEYRPLQHQSMPQGYEHETIFASIELWADDPPEYIMLGDFRYKLDSAIEGACKQQSL